MQAKLGFKLLEVFLLESEEFVFEFCAALCGEAADTAVTSDYSMAGSSNQDVFWLHLRLVGAWPEDLGTDADENMGRKFLFPLKHN